MKHLFVALSLICLLSSSVFAVTYHVNPVTGNDARSAAEATLPATPWQTLLHAAATAAPGSTIVLQPGLYVDANEHWPIALTNLIVTGESPAATLEGSVNPLLSLNGNVTIAGCTINHTSGVDGDTPLKGNGSNLNVLYNRIVKTSSPRKGMGVDFYPGVGCSGVVRGNTIVGFAAGVYCNAETGPLLIENNTIRYNSNGVHYNNTGTVTVIGNIICKKGGLDEAPLPGTGAGNGINYDDTATGTLNNSYNCFFNNFTDLKGAAAGVGTVYSYPRFVDPWNDDYRLFSDSPCIGAYSGNNIGAAQGGGLSGSPYRETAYVSPNGSDTTGNGSSGAPYQTIEKGLKYALSKVSLAAGSYTPAAALQIGQGRQVSGAGRDATVITSAVAQTAVYMTANSSLDNLSLNGSAPAPDPYIAIFISKGRRALLSDCNLALTGVSTLSAVVLFHNSTGEANSCLVKGGTYGIYSLVSANPSVRPQQTPQTVTAESCTIVNFQGYGVTSDYDTVHVRNCIISCSPEGTATASSCGVANISFPTGEVFSSYNDVYLNSKNYSNVAPGSGALSAEALFVSAGSGNYHLTAASPCIDAGDPASPADPDGSRHDLGCFPFYHSNPSTTTTTTTTTTTLPQRRVSFRYGRDAAGAMLDYSFNASQSEPVTIIVEDPGPPHQIVLEKTITAQAGLNSDSLPFLKFGSKALAPGVYNYRIIFHVSGTVLKGKIVFKPGT